MLFASSFFEAIHLKAAKCMRILDCVDGQNVQNKVSKKINSLSLFLLIQEIWEERKKKNEIRSIKKKKRKEKKLNRIWKMGHETTTTKKKYLYILEY